jgi:hypothetical protein
VRIYFEQPVGGWTVASLQEALSTLCGELPVRVFVPFDGEGPCTWSSPVIEVDDGAVKIASDKGDFFSR